MKILNTRRMLEAARLTGAGQLGDATALLRKGLLAGAGRVAGTGALEAAAAALPGALRAALGDVVGRSAAPGPTTRQPPSPAGARFESRERSGPEGARPYRLYVPSTLTQNPALMVMLHGCQQDPVDFAAGTRMNEHAELGGFLVVYPGQTRTANGSGCWNWFSDAHQRRDSGEAAVIAAATRAVLEEFGADPQRVWAAGLSAGGAAAAIVGNLYPDLFAAVGVHSGLACGAAHDVPGAFSAMRSGGAPSRAPGGRVSPTIVFHGDRDGTVHPSNAGFVSRQALGQEAGLTATVREGISPSGIAFTATRRMRGAALAGEEWVLHGVGHAWSGGSPNGSYVEPRGPDASGEMLRFFREVSAARA